MKPRHRAIQPKPAGKEDGFRSVLVLLDAMESPDQSVSSAAARGLGLICLMDPELPSEFTFRMLGYFEHKARYSPSAGMREACIDAIYICRDIGRLRGLDFQSGCHETSLYRDRAASALRAELELKC